MSDEFFRNSDASLTVKKPEAAKHIQSIEVVSSLSLKVCDNTAVRCIEVDGSSFAPEVPAANGNWEVVGTNRRRGGSI